MDYQKYKEVALSALGNRKLLYLGLSGSHAWGLNRPDSDLDLIGIYQEHTNKVLSIRKSKDVVNKKIDVYDLQLFEIEKFLKLLCNNNGNMVTWLKLPNQIYVDDVVDWDSLADNFITKELKKYYKGYAFSQRQRTASERGGKALIYTYRELFCGLYLMKYGQLEFSFQELWETARKNGWYEHGLLDRYFDKVMANEKVSIISDSGWVEFYNEWNVLTKLLDEESEKSSLPDKPVKNIEEVCSNILIALRIENLLNSFDSCGMD